MTIMQDEMVRNNIESVLWTAAGAMERAQNVLGMDDVTLAGYVRRYAGEGFANWYFGVSR